MEFEHMTEKKVNYKVRYTGGDMPDIKHGKIYQCVAEWYDEDGDLDTYSVIDETGESYLYDEDQIEKVEGVTARKER